jgi:hypothetical protein
MHTPGSQPVGESTVMQQNSSLEQSESDTQLRGVVAGAQVLA